MEYKKNKIVFTSHAAGGAQILSSWIRQTRPQGEYLFYLSGPAKAIFRDKLGDITLCSPDVIDQLDVSSDQLIAGSGWNPPFERKAVERAKSRGIATAVFIDHWKNYKERFLPEKYWGVPLEDWQKYLPDKVYVCDEYALNLALYEGIPDYKLYQIVNPYFEEFKADYFLKKNKLKTRVDSRLHVLYISEPIADHYKKTYGNDRYLGYHEFDLLNDLCVGLALSPNLSQEIIVHLRLHPSDDQNKYNKFADENESISISRELNLIDDMVRSDFIVGGDSMALALSAAVGLPTYSCLPVNAKFSCTIPIKEIKKRHHFTDVFKEVLAQGNHL